MIHTRLQLDPGAEISLRPGSGGTVEIVVLDPSSEASLVVELTPEQLAGICEAAAVS